MGDDFQFGRGQHGRQFVAPEPERVDAAGFEAHSAELAAALQSPWQPRCIARAWATRGAGDLDFTLQAWIDLDAARSPLLVGVAPSTPGELRAAFLAFGLDFDGNTSPEDTALIVSAMQREIAAGFAAALEMRQPDAEEETGEVDGFGSWMPLLACLVTQCGLAPGLALRLGVAQARTLIATHRRNQGWHVAGTPYALREDAEGITNDQAPMTKEEAADG